MVLSKAAYLLLVELAKPLLALVLREMGGLLSDGRSLEIPACAARYDDTEGRGYGAKDDGRDRLRHCIAR